MSLHCENYERFELGQLTEADFEAHAAGCGICRELRLADENIVTQAARLNEPIEAPLLWERIWTDLQLETSHPESRPWFAADSRWLRFAAMLTLVVAGGLAGRYLFNSAAAQERLLTAGALARVEATEAAYAEAIESLEASAEPALADMDLDIMLLYRDRLAMIDAQILGLKEAIEGNPANGHLRRYMAAALRDKRETLEEVLGR